MKHMAWAVVATAVLTTVAWSCGGGGDGGGNPNPGGPSNPLPSTATVTISSTGTTTSGAGVAIGGTVTFVNNDSVAHEMSSNPHPVHTDCPALNIGTLQPQQSRTRDRSRPRGRAASTIT